MIGLDFSVWLTIAVMHALAVASPGPDFAIVLKQSLQYGRRLAVWTSIGVGVGILLHVAYSLLGVGLIIKTNEWLAQALVCVAAGYLIYIGQGALRSRPNSETITACDQQIQQSAGKAFIIGFLTNGLNPKATLFFLALYSVAIPLDASLIAKGIYGIYLAVATGCWFVLVSIMASHSRIRNAYQKKGYVFDRVMGAVIILMAIFLVISG